MRRIILLSTIVLLSAVLAVTQVNSNSARESATAPSTTIEGCLDGAIGNYTLTDHSGASYRLIGNTEEFKAHVGETMRVTGLVKTVMNVPGAMSEGTETRPTFSVISFTRISGVCSEGNKLP